MMIDSLRKDQSLRINVMTALSTIINGFYAVGNLAFGLINGSFWFVTIGAYFLVLCAMRAGCISALRSKNEKKIYAGRLVGLLLILMCIVLAGSVVLSDRLDVIKPVHRIVMIAAAAFTTAKAAIAVINVVKARKSGNSIWFAIRNITCADAAGSVLSMQRSMLVSLGDMDAGGIRLLNLLTGIGTCAVVLLLGIILLRRRPV